MSNILGVKSLNALDKVEEEILVRDFKAREAEFEAKQLDALIQIERLKTEYSIGMQRYNPHPNSTDFGDRGKTAASKTAGSVTLKIPSDLAGASYAPK